MDVSEIEYLEARLSARSRLYPSPEQMECYIAKAHQERSRALVDGFLSTVKTLKGFVQEVRRIAVACTAARLHLPNV